MLDVGGQDLVVWVPPAGKHAFRQLYKDAARREKRRAADAGNAANTSQLVGGGIGCALATSGVVALATASAPLALPAIIATGVAILIGASGLIAGHWMNKRKFAHEELMERYSETAEELK